MRTHAIAEAQALLSDHSAGGCPRLTPPSLTGGERPASASPDDPWAGCAGNPTGRATAATPSWQVVPRPRWPGQPWATGYLCAATTWAFRLTHLDISARMRVHLPPRVGHRWARPKGAGALNLGALGPCVRGGERLDLGRVWQPRRRCSIPPTDYAKPPVLPTQRDGYPAQALRVTSRVRPPEHEWRTWARPIWMPLRPSRRVTGSVGSPGARTATGPT